MRSPPHHEVTWLRAADGLPLALRRWSGGQGAPVLICPGRAEPAVKYDEVAADLVGMGLDPWAHDWRGQGASAREQAGRGWVKRFDDYLRDLEAHVEHIREVTGSRPVLLGHSMGGHVALRYASRYPVPGLIVTAPMVDLSLPLGGWFSRPLLAVAARAGLGRRRLGRRRIDVPFEDNRLTLDRDRYERFQRMLQAHPELQTGPPSVQWLKAALVSIDELWNELPHIEAPALVFAATLDDIVSPAAVRRCAGLLPEGRFVPLSGRHELMFEVQSVRIALWAEVESFFTERGALA